MTEIKPKIPANISNSKTDVNPEIPIKGNDEQRPQKKNPESFWIQIETKSV